MNLLNLFFRLSIFTLYSYPPTWTVVKSNYILKMIDLVEYTITLTLNTASGLIPVQLCGFGCAFHRVRYIELRKWWRIEISEKEALLLLLDSSFSNTLDRYGVLKFSCRHHPTYLLIWYISFYWQFILWQSFLLSSLSFSFSLFSFESTAKNQRCLSFKKPKR